MSVREILHHDAAPTDVYAMLTDEAFQSAAMTATGALDHEVEVRPGGTGGTDVVTRRTLPTDQAPDAVRTMIGSSVLVTQTTRWGAQQADGSRVAHTALQIEGVPVSVAGTVRLVAAAAGGTDQIVDAEISSKVPLVGRKLVQAARPLISSALRAEHRAAQAWSAR